MSTLSVDAVVRLLRNYVAQTASAVDLLLIGRLALQAYGATNPQTEDLDAEVVGDFDTLVAFLAQHGIPSNVGENISGWSVIAMPPGYRERASVFLEEDRLRVRLLAPVDFIIAKLRRGTEDDLEDALFVAQKFGIRENAVKSAAELAIAASPKDIALFAFRKTVELFCRRL